jgi:hypothetical protein
VLSATPSGLFPSGPHRPTFREAHPVRVPAVIVGGALTLAWLLLMGLFASSVRGLIALELLAVGIAAGVAGLLLRFGDRGGAVGVGIAAAAGGCLATAVAIARWVTVGWPL